MTTEERSEAIKRTYNRAVNACLKALHAASVEARTYTVASEQVHDQEAHIARLKQLEEVVAETAKNPTGEFNWDWA